MQWRDATLKMGWETLVTFASVRYVVRFSKFGDGDSIIIHVFVAMPAHGLNYVDHAWSYDSIFSFFRRAYVDWRARIKNANANIYALVNKGIAKTGILPHVLQVIFL